jgi:LPXTG-site transpeptidase (sortase) family protein
VSISIPAIDVRSELITLGVNPDGTLQVPQPGPDYDKAAWFDGSPRPGEVGPAVIEGHVDSAANGPSVFYSLGEVVAGDRIDVARADGSTVTFQVDEVRVVPKDDFPTLEVYGNTDGPELRLITCGGPFDSSDGHYEDNVVVFASQVA